MKDAKSWIICATQHPDPSRREEAVQLLANVLAAHQRVRELLNRVLHMPQGAYIADIESFLAEPA